MTNNYVYSIPQDVLKLSSNAKIQIGFQECFGIITHNLYFMATIPAPSSNHPNLFRKTGRSQDFQRRLCAVWDRSSRTSTSGPSHRQGTCPDFKSSTVTVYVFVQSRPSRFNRSRYPRNIRFLGYTVKFLNSKLQFIFQGWISIK